MEIMRAHARATRRAPGEYFTGTVWQDPIVEAPEPARLIAVTVTFAPGARTFWHTHPLGQTLHVVSGVGRIQEEGGPLRTLHPGDTVWIPPGIRHWHGAAPDHAMTHIAMQERRDGAAVTWLDEVAESDYTAAPTD